MFVHSTALKCSLFTARWPCRAVWSCPDVCSCGWNWELPPGAGSSRLPLATGASLLPAPAPAAQPPSTAGRICSDFPCLVSWGLQCLGFCLKKKIKSYLKRVFSHKFSQGVTRKQLSEKYQFSSLVLLVLLISLSLQGTPWATTKIQRMKNNDVLWLQLQLR